jgi:hypothetical protein
MANYKEVKQEGSGVMTKLARYVKMVVSKAQKPSLGRQRHLSTKEKQDMQTGRSSRFTPFGSTSINLVGGRWESCLRCHVFQYSWDASFHATRISFLIQLCFLPILALQNFYKSANPNCLQVCAINRQTAIQIPLACTNFTNLSN